MLATNTMRPLLRISNTNSTQQLSLMLVYSIYRFGIALILWILFFTATGIGEENPTLFTFSGLSYLAINILLLVRAAAKWQPAIIWLLLIIASDIILIQFIAIASGAIGSGLGVLMIVSVAAGSLFLKRKSALMVPSFATITLLTTALVSVLQDSATKTELVASGWLGILFFTASALISYLAEQVESSEARANREFAHAKNLERLNSLIIERMQTGIIVTDHLGKIISQNESAVKLFNNTANNKPIQKLNDINPEIFKFQKTIQSQLTHNSHSNKFTNAPFSMQLETNNITLKLTWIILDNKPTSEMLVFVEDLSRIAQQAQQLKLSSLGKLAASIAHEIRNPIGAANHAAQLLKEQDLCSEDDRLSQIIIDQTKRCSNIIESVLDVSRGKVSNIQQHDLNTWLPKFVNNYSIGKSCNIEIITPPNLLINFDHAQLEQILTNLLDNALRYSFEKTNEHFACIHGWVDNDNRPRLDIFDNGNGVSEKHLNRLFEPFFTSGKTGSGLGLYMCRELCEANQANISYINESTNISPLKKFTHCFRLQFSHLNRKILNLAPKASFQQDIQ